MTKKRRGTHRLTDCGARMRRALPLNRRPFPAGEAPKPAPVDAGLLSRLPATSVHTLRIRRQTLRHGNAGNAVSAAPSPRELSIKQPVYRGKSTKKIGKHKAFRRLLEDIRNQNRTFTVTATVPLPRRAVHRGGTPFSQGARERSATCAPNLRTYTFRRFGRKKKRSAVCGPTSSVKRCSAI